MSVLYWSDKSSKGMQRWICLNGFNRKQVSWSNWVKKQQWTYYWSFYICFIIHVHTVHKQRYDASSGVNQRVTFVLKKKSHEISKHIQCKWETKTWPIQTACHFFKLLWITSCCLYCIKWHKNGITYMYVNTCTSITIHTACQSSILLILQKKILVPTPTSNIAFIPYHL